MRPGKSQRRLTDDKTRRPLSVPRGTLRPMDWATDGRQHPFTVSYPTGWKGLPFTGGGQALNAHAKEYMARVETEAAGQDFASRRHHYVPQCYLRAWSEDGRRVRVVDTQTGAFRAQGIRDTCVEENFYLAHAPATGAPYNQFERMMAVLDEELARVIRVFSVLRPGDSIETEDFMALGHMMALSRVRTPQLRRMFSIQMEYGVRLTDDDAMAASRTERFWATGGEHGAMILRSMFKGADLMCRRQLEIWDDSNGRFITSDQPIQLEGSGHIHPTLLQASRIWWPISPMRAIALEQYSRGVQVQFEPAGAKVVQRVNGLMVRGRERMLVCMRDQGATLPVGKPMHRRAQAHIRCRPQDDNSCIVGFQTCYGKEPDIAVCELHRPFFDPLAYA